jgi:hypothetical protein
MTINCVQVYNQIYFFPRNPIISKGNYVSLFKFLIEFHPTFMWHIFQTIVELLISIVTTYVLNQFSGH